LNDAPNHLHGGVVGFDKHVWEAEPVRRDDGAESVRLWRVSPDGEEGYPGQVRATVTFTLTDRNEFIFETEVLTDRATPVSLTHHSYFNLAGEAAGPVVDHVFQVRAQSYAPTDGAMTLLGRREPTEGAGCDLRNPRRLGDALPGIFRGHGDLYFLDRPPGRPADLVVAARVAEPASGRTLEVRTTEDCIQLYSGASLDGSLRGKSGTPYGRHHGFCLECEGYPDGANVPALGSILVPPGAARKQVTIYAFSFD
jgi:aldose 1-epimerase